MIFLYNLILILLSIVFLPVILAAFIIQPKFRAGFFTKLGFYGEKNQKSIIFHAVSVGEVNAIKDLVKAYRESHPDDYIIVTTTTKTGQEIAQKSLKQYANKITYFPYDYFFSVLSFFNTLNPEKIVIAETEIWPCFVSLAKSKNIKVYTVNGRISPKSYNGYKKISAILVPVLNKYEKIFMQTKEDAQRMIDIGASPDKVEVMGNLKFDINANLEKSEINRYLEELKSKNFRIFTAASTHKGEDEIVINAFKKLKEKHKDAKLLLVPRHPERWGEVSCLLNGSNLKWGKRSNKDNFEVNDVILLDTMGELSKLFSICYIAFIGGSFTPTGGHNPLEANIWNKPVISGKTVFNFKDVYKIITEKQCAVIVENESELAEKLINFYSDSELYNTFCQNAKTVFDENKGALQYVLTRI